MNSKTLLTVTSVVLGLAGLSTLFVPQEILAAFDLPTNEPLPVLIQLTGSLYFAFSLLNWTARSNAIGGIYSRPVSLCNFAHFFVGTLTLANHQVTTGSSRLLLVALAAYAGFAFLFWRLVFSDPT